MLKGAEVIRGTKALISDIQDRADRLFPKDNNPHTDIRSMIPADAIGEALASEDLALQGFVYDWLREKYPGVQIFQDRESFFKFVEKWGVRGFNVDPNAIGHAFMNAVFIDPKTERQSSMMHEHAHIYWDALPDDHPVKQSLREIYQKIFPDILELDDIDEMIILDVGRSATEDLRVMFKNSTARKVIDLLRDFWAAVLKLFGVKSKGNYINQLSYAIINNSDKIRIRTGMGSKLIRSMISFDQVTYNPRFIEEGHIHQINGIPVPSVTQVLGLYKPAKFDEVRQSKVDSHKFSFMYKSAFGEKRSEDRQQEDTDAMYKLYSEDYKESGTAIHSVAESVFGNKRMDPDVIETHFRNYDTYLQTRSIFEREKQHLINLYGNDVEFITEKQIISDKYKMAGIADLIIDLGNNELIIYDFKTVDYELSDEEGKAQGKYTDTYGLYMSPFQNMPISKYNDHTIQLNMYANMLEEQQNPNQPGEKNHVKYLRIFPVVRRITDGVVQQVRRGNIVAIPRNDRTKKMAERMMELDYIKRGNLVEKYQGYADELMRQEVPIPIINDMIKAFHYFNSTFSDIKNIKKDEIAQIRNAGERQLLARLISSVDEGGLGFNRSDLFGEGAMSAEELFFIATSTVPITRELYFGYTKDGVTYPPLRDKFYKSHMVYKYLKPTISENAPRGIWHQTKEGFIVKEIGNRDLQAGKEIMMIYTYRAPGGKLQEDKYYYTVEKWDPKSKKAILKNSDTKENISVYMGLEKYGAYEIHSKAPDHVSVQKFVPRFIYEVEEKMEMHWDIKFRPFVGGSVEENSRKQIVRERQRRFVWKFFNEIKTWADLQKFFEDYNNTADFYENFSVFEDEAFEQLILFAREEAVNHNYANAVSNENKAYDDKPNSVMPLTLNLFYMLTQPNKAVWKDFNVKFARNWLPPRFIGNKYVPASFTLYETQVEYNKYHQHAFDLAKDFDEFEDEEINYAAAQIMVGDTTYWKRPQEVNADSFPRERAFLELIYKYHTQYDREFIELKKLPGRKNQRVKVSQVFATREEFVSRIDSRFGSLMHDKLKPMPFDGIVIPLVERFLPYGSVKLKKDPKTGQVQTKTLREIKEDFVRNHGSMTDNEKLRWLGKKWRHRYLRIPSTNRVAGRSASGMLNYYIKQAEKAYYSGGDQYNPDVIVSKKRRKIHVVGQGNAFVPTRKYASAERAAINSMIFAHYMKRLMAPLDFIYATYTDEGKRHSVIGNYVKDWMDYQLYGIRPEDKIFGSIGTQRFTELINFINRMNSANKMLLSPMTQVNNLLIGQSMDIIRDPNTWRKGVQRLSKGNIINNVVKAYNILSRFNIANIVTDVSFDMLKDDMKLFGIEQLDWEKMENIGYWPMEFVEKLNQFPIFVGLMTDEEWEGYDQNGRRVNKKGREPLTSARVAMIAERAKDLHGDYGVFNAAPAWLTNAGRLAMPFRKWLPTLLHAYFAPYYIDHLMLVKSGIIPTYRLLFKVMQYNSKKDSDKMKKLLEEIENTTKEDYATDAFFGKTNEYMNLLIEQVKGDKIKWKDLSPSDRRNFVAGLQSAAIVIGTALINYYLIKSQGDDDRYKKYATRAVAQVFNRYQGDVFFIFSLDSWKFLNENLIPSASFAVDIAMVGNDLVNTISGIWNAGKEAESKYSKETQYGKRGAYKLPVSLTRIIPFGAFGRFMIRNVVQARMRMTPAEKSVLTEIHPDVFENIDLSNLSQWDIHENFYKWRKDYRDIVYAATVIHLRNQNIPLDSYAAITISKSILEKERERFREALGMIALDEKFGDKEINVGGVTDMKEIRKLASELEKAMKRYESDKERKTVEKGLESIENIR